MKSSFLRFFVIFVFIFSFFQNILAMQEPQIPLKILDATYGFLDKDLRSGEYIVLQANFGKHAYVGTWKGGRIRLHDKKKIKAQYIFKIEGENLKPGEKIPANSIVTLQNLKSKHYFGVEKRGGVWGSDGSPLTKRPYASELKTKEPTTKWQLKVIGNKNDISNEGIILLHSQAKKGNAHKFKGSNSALVVDGSSKGPRSQYKIYRVGKIGDNFKALTHPQITKIFNNQPISEILSSFIQNGNINYKGNFDKDFGTLGFDSALKLFKQIEVKYSLGTGKTFTHTFEQGKEEIEIPTETEATECKALMTEKSTTLQNLTLQGFVKLNFWLEQISIFENFVVGINNINQALKWNSQKQTFEPLGDGTIKFKQIAVGKNGLTFAIGVDNKLYKTTISDKSIWKKVFEDNLTGVIPSENNFLSVTLSDGKNIYLLNTNKKVQKLTLPNKLENLKDQLFKQIYIGIDNSLFGLTPEGKLFRLLGKDWIEIIGKSDFKQIFVLNMNSIWGKDNFDKHFKFEGRNWEEQLWATNVFSMIENSFGENWALVTEIPPNQNGYAVYVKEKNVFKFKDIIYLKNISSSYLTIKPDDSLEAINQWPTESEKLQLINPSNNSDASPIKFLQEIILKSVANNTYLQFAPQKDMATNTIINTIINTPDITKATSWKIINSAATDDSKEITKGSEVPVLFETKEGLQLGANKGGNVFVDEQKEALDKKWKLESPEQI